MKTDVIVIGSGQAGIPLATRLASANKNVVLFERAALGGTCTNYGCTPTKTMVASARAAHVARTAGRLGVKVIGVEVDFPAVVARKDAVVAQWHEGIDKRIADAGERLTVIQSHARFVGTKEVEAGGKRYAADTIILNVGARPIVPKVPGLEGVPFLDNTKLMALKALPKHLLVLGGGYIGCEFGQMFRRFGAEVTVVDHHGHLLAREDEEISNALEEVFRKEGISLQLGTEVESARKDGNDVVLRLKSGKELRGSHVLVATGRRPNTDDLGCDAAGVKLDAHGFIVIDDGWATSVPGVYAVGDATGEPQFTHTSWDDHRLLYERLVSRPSHGRSDRVIPYTVFTDPQVAGVGATERALRAKNVEFESATMPFGYIARALELDEKAGTMKILIDPKTEQVLGARIVGSEAGELIHLFAALMQAKQSVRAIVDMEAVHPTFTEGVQALVMRLPRFALKT
ncbi:PF00070 family, FAD-dependent NAD(P)-disulfide oxidoreductase [Labilithrix luteola]|uniref:PF00070 family, FAD-dependent NAD(P)-disulfide oxidoreductase n=1 Tax=Labilithrix luteola TaxID=1391654 RepID=A0A0K1PUB0_9BACT|nr:mercuric reductase [Labilithrix luteola]AKU96956.1 PF00070 family, FAD-dependent NAD(P)-disulfide oxidoreductase [Labilithrix luteola]